MYRSIALLYLVLAAVFGSLAVRIETASARDTTPPSSSSSSNRQQQNRQKQPEAYQERLVEWLLEDPNGFFHQSIRWERLGPNGSYAMHATEDIPKGTPLIVLPRKYVLESHQDPQASRNENNKDQTNDPRMCTTVSKMLWEYNRDEESFYAPYLSYLFEDTAGGTTRGLLPTSWSKHSRKILDLILRIEDWDESLLFPYDYEFDSILHFCGDGEDLEEDHDEEEFEEEEEEQQERVLKDTKNYYIDDTPTGTRFRVDKSDDRSIPVDPQMAEDAYLFLSSRGWHDKLLPVIDMFNHRNGPGRNVEITPIDDKGGDDVAAYAWKDIAKGDQLQYTYSECMDESCGYGDIKYSYSTQSIFADYGFVELTPQRWMLESPFELPEEHFRKVIAEVTTDPNDKLVLKWIFATPTKENIAWFRNQLSRLKSIQSIVEKGADEVLLKEGDERTIHNIPHEREALLEFHNAYVRVFELALEHQHDPVSVTGKEFLEELQVLKSSGDTKTIHDLRQHPLLRSQQRLSNKMNKKDLSSKGGEL